MGVAVFLVADQEIDFESIILADGRLQEFALLFGAAKINAPVFLNEEDGVGQFIAKEPVVKDDRSIVRLIIVQLAAGEDHALSAIPKVSGEKK